MKAKLVNVGRSQYCGEVTFNSIRTLRSAIQKKLRSKGWALSFGNGDTTAGIYVGGCRRIGTVELIDGKFKVLNDDNAVIIPVESKQTPGKPNFFG